MRFPVIFCFLAVLVSYAIATPARVKTTTTKKTTTTRVTTTRITTTTTTVAPPEPTTTNMHDCSVFIQRWLYAADYNVFDVTYHEHHWTPDSLRWAIYIQESQPNVQTGEYIPSRQMGSEVLKILNVQNPIAYPFSPTDTGRVTVTWGSSYTANSWDPASGCQVNVYRGIYERATYLCNFQCNVPLTGSG